MGLQSTDLFIVERAGVQYQMNANEISDFLGAVNDLTSNSYDDMVIDVFVGGETPKTGDRIFVADASNDPTVDTGWAVYRYNGSGYDKIQEQESMDLLISATTNLDYVPGPASGTITNDAGNNAIIPLVDGTNSGLASPQMFNNSHVLASSGLTAASNPVVVNTSNQQVTFNITQLTPLP